MYQGNIVTDKEYVNNDVNHTLELEDEKLCLINSANKPTFEYQKDDYTPAQVIYSGEIEYVGNKVGTY